MNRSICRHIFYSWLATIGKDPIKNSRKLFLSIFAWGHTGFSFEEIAKCGLAGEVQAVGDLADKYVFALQQHFGLYQCGTVNPIHHTPSADFGYQSGQIVWRESQFVGIERDRPILIAILIYKFFEMTKSFFLTTLPFCRV